MLDQKHCDNDGYGSFSTIQSAKDACSKDTNCQGVYDRDCNSVGSNVVDDIHLCPTSAKYSKSLSGCIFQKNKNGIYSKSFNFIQHKGNGSAIINISIITFVQHQPYQRLLQLHQQQQKPPQVIKQTNNYFVPY